MPSPQERAQNYLGALDKELSKYPTLDNLEKQSGVPKAYAVVGFAALYFFLIILNQGGQLLTHLAGFVIGGYYSLQALFTPGTADDTQWLTYWVVFAFLAVLEGFGIVFWVPFYYVFKFIFLLWLSLPPFHGAQILFRSFLAPTLSRYFTPSVGSSASTLRSKAEGFSKSE